MRTVPATEFFQNNFFLLPELVSAVRDSLRSSGSRYLVDLYCGVGFFGIELAGDVQSFAGVEMDKKAIGAARNNAGAKGVKNGQFLIGSAHELFPQVMEKKPPAETTVIIDPPRTGCTPEMIALLRQTRASRSRC